MDIIVDALIDSLYIYNMAKGTAAYQLGYISSRTITEVKQHWALKASTPP